MMKNIEDLACTWREVVSAMPPKIDHSLLSQKNKELNTLVTLAILNTLEHGSMETSLFDKAFDKALHVASIKKIVLIDKLQDLCQGYFACKKFNDGIAAQVKELMTEKLAKLHGIDETTAPIEQTDFIQDDEKSEPEPMEKHANEQQHIDPLVERLLAAIKTKNFSLIQDAINTFSDTDRELMSFYLTKLKERNSAFNKNAFTFAIQTVAKKHGVVDISISL